MSARDTDDLIADADARANAGDEREAARLYQEICVRAPLRAEGFVGLARLLASERDFDQTMRLLVRAASADPGHVPTYALAARLGLRFHREASALRLLQAGALARDDSPLVFLWLARLQSTLGQLSPLRQTLRHLETLTGVRRDQLVAEVMADDDVSEKARTSLKRVSGLQVV